MAMARTSRIWRIILLTITIFSLCSPALAKYSGGTGEPNDPYQIATAEDLIALGETPEDYDKHFILTADIDLDPNLPGRKVFDKAVIAPGTYRTDSPQFFQGTPFTGVFDGNGYTISHLTIVGGSYLGLFGKLQPRFFGRDDVKKLGVVDVNIIGSGKYIGGLVGFNNFSNITTSYSSGGVSGSDSVGGFVGFNNGGHVAHCHSSGFVIGNSHVGGLVGLQNRPDKRTITDSYSTTAVTAITEYAGGLVGTNYGWVVRCYSTGPVAAPLGAGGLIGRNFGSIAMSYSSGSANGISYIGGLVGINNHYGYYYVGDIIKSYSTGSVSGQDLVGGLVGHNNSSISSSFWDIQTSTQLTSAAGTGKTTAEMQTVSTFLDAGWDFVGETANGTEDIWWILEGQDYPRLWWEAR